MSNKDEEHRGVAMRHRAPETKEEIAESKSEAHSLKEALQCPLSYSRLENPVVGETGVSSEKETTENYIAFRESKGLDCPDFYNSDSKLTKKSLIPNHTLKAAIKEFDALKNTNLKEFYIKKMLAWLMMDRNCLDEKTRQELGLEKSIWPFALICPVTLIFFTDPVIDEKGNSYERSAAPKESKTIPNVTLRNVIETFNLDSKFTNAFSDKLKQIQQRVTQNKNRIIQLELKISQQKKSIRRWKIIGGGTILCTGLVYAAHSFLTLQEERQSERDFQLALVDTPSSTMVPTFSSCNFNFVGKEILKPLFIPVIDCIVHKTWNLFNCDGSNSDLKRLSWSRPEEVDKLLEDAIQKRLFKAIDQGFQTAQDEIRHSYSAHGLATAFIKRLKLAVQQHDLVTIRFFTLVNPEILKLHQTILAHAMKVRAKKIVNLLFEYDLPLTLKDVAQFSEYEFGEYGSPLYHAVTQNRPHWVKTLIEKAKKRSIDLYDDDNKSPNYKLLGLARILRKNRFIMLDTLMNSHIFPQQALSDVFNQAIGDNDLVFLKRYSAQFKEHLASFRHDEMVENLVLPTIESNQLELLSLILENRLTSKIVISLMNKALKIQNLTALKIILSHAAKLDNKEYVKALFDRVRYTTSYPEIPIEFRKELLKALTKFHLSNEDYMGLVTNFHVGNLELLDTLLTAQKPSDNNPLIYFIHHRAADEVKIILRHCATSENFIKTVEILFFGENRETLTTILGLSDESFRLLLEENGFVKFIEKIVTQNDTKALDSFLEMGRALLTFHEQKFWIHSLKLFAFYQKPSIKIDIEEISNIALSLIFNAFKIKNFTALKTILSLIVKINSEKFTQHFCDIIVGNLKETPAELIKELIQSLMIHKEHLSNEKYTNLIVRLAETNLDLLDFIPKLKPTTDESLIHFVNQNKYQFGPEHISAVKIILRNYEPTVSKSQELMSVMERLFWTSDKEIIKMLLSFKSESIDALIKEGKLEEPITRAIRLEDTELFEVFLKAGVVRGRSEDPDIFIRAAFDDYVIISKGDILRKLAEYVDIKPFIDRAFSVVKKAETAAAATPGFFSSPSVEYSVAKSYIKTYVKVFGPYSPEENLSSGLSLS